MRLCRFAAVDVSLGVGGSGVLGGGVGGEEVELAVLLRLLRTDIFLRSRAAGVVVSASELARLALDFALWYDVRVVPLLVTRYVGEDAGEVNAIVGLVACFDSLLLRSLTLPLRLS